MPRNPTPSQPMGDRPATTHRESTILFVSRWARWGPQVLAGAIATLAAGLTGLEVGLVQSLERQVQQAHFELRGPVAPPQDVIILAIDESSLAQAEFYRTDPDRYAHLQLLQSWPWQRSAYAIAIERILEAGGRAVTLDILLVAASSYGPEDDARLAETLANYPNQVVLAAQYTQAESDQGLVTQLVMPNPVLRSPQTRLGTINFFLEPNGRIHRLGDQFLTEVMRTASPAQRTAYQQVFGTLPTLADATLQAAQVNPPAAGDTIFFYGPAQTFTHLPFWYVLDPDTWDTYLQGGDYFKDKIVVIGSTAAIHQDFYPTPFSNSWFYPFAMPGVEIHANAIATQMEGRGLRPVLPQAPLQGLLVLLGVGGASVVVVRQRQTLSRWGLAMAIALLWWCTSYGLFVYGGWIIPTAMPAGALMMIGLGQLVSGTAQDQVRKQQLRETLKQYSTSPIVQEIISQQEDMQDLLRERERELAGKLLGSRYKIVNVLGSGGFSETYTAKDLQRPGHPICVVKQLQVKTDNPKTIRLARRLFTTEAETLEKLGHHDQIPQLMAFFEEAGDFYLIQEFVAGRSLAEEFRQRHSFPEFYVVDLLQDLLNVLVYVHAQGVIHRDLKPSNIIRRQSDQRLVLIDFGVAKKLSTQIADLDPGTKFTVAVGTPGYMPSEQSVGRPHFNSDIYALGVIAIEALTGQNPRLLHHDSKTGALLWKHRVPGLTSLLSRIVDGMVHHDFTQRYQTAQQVKDAIAPLLEDEDSVILDDANNSPLSWPSHLNRSEVDTDTTIHPDTQGGTVADDLNDETTVVPSDCDRPQGDGLKRWDQLPTEVYAQEDLNTELTPERSDSDLDEPHPSSAWRSESNQTVGQQDTQGDDEPTQMGDWEHKSP
jgi:CHASE2 domain-containing sensor protein/serine/threonine protein kinase